MTRPRLWPTALSRTPQQAIPMRPGRRRTSTIRRRTGSVASVPVNGARRAVHGGCRSLLRVALVAFACTAPAVRPHFGPLPAAVIDTLALPPESVIVALGGRLAESGLRVR